MFKNGWLNSILLLIVCTALGFIDALRSYIAAFSNRQAQVDFITLLQWDLSAWSFWVFIVPIIFYQSKYWMINKKNWYLRLSAYFGLGILLSFGKTLFPFFLKGLFISDFSDVWSWLSVRWFYLITDFLFAFIFFCFILAFSQALNYYRQFQAEELRNSRLELQLSRAELLALKTQLQPHFIFNALHSISAHLQKPEVARTMITRLGDFLRMTLANVGTQEVSLKKEIEFLRCYLEIEQMRFRDRLTVEIEVEPDTWDAQVPNLILQPLVENSIKHGLAPRSAPSRIVVQAKHFNDNLQLQIEDNGCGLQNENGNGGVTSIKEGVGLQTTRARLSQLYPAKHLFQLCNSPKGGLIVTLEIPFRIEKTT